MDNNGASDSEIKACSSLRGHFPYSLFNANCEIRVSGWFLGLFVDYM